MGCIFHDRGAQFCRKGCVKPAYLQTLAPNKSGKKYLEVSTRAWRLCYISFRSIGPKCEVGFKLYGHYGGSSMSHRVRQSSLGGVIRNMWFRVVNKSPGKFNWIMSSRGGASFGNLPEQERLLQSMYVLNSDELKKF